MRFAEKMLDMLTSAYDRTDLPRIRSGDLPKTNIGKLFYLSGWGFDIIKDQSEKVRLWDDIDQAQGAALDRIGKNYGVIRGTASDSIYRVMIKVKMLAMLAAGNLDTLILSAASLFGVDISDVACEELFPAKVYLYINEDSLDEEHREIAPIIASLMERIKAAGVGIRIFYRVYRSRQAPVYFGAATCITTFMTIESEPLNKQFVGRADARFGAAAAIFVSAAYPAERRTTWLEP